jgi:hypothetical protein
MVSKCSFNYPNLYTEVMYVRLTVKNQITNGLSLVIFGINVKQAVSKSRHFMARGANVALLAILMASNMGQYSVQ